MNVFWHTAEPLGCASARVGHDVSSRLCWNSRSEAQRAGDYSSFFCCIAGDLCQPLSQEPGALHAQSRFAWREFKTFLMSWRSFSTYSLLKWGLRKESLHVEYSCLTWFYKSAHSCQSFSATLMDEILKLTSHQWSPLLTHPDTPLIQQLLKQQQGALHNLLPTAALPLSKPKAHRLWVFSFIPETQNSSSCPFFCFCSNQPVVIQVWASSSLLLLSP